MVALRKVIGPEKDHNERETNFGDFLCTKRLERGIDELKDRLNSPIIYKYFSPVVALVAPRDGPP